MKKIYSLLFFILFLPLVSLFAQSPEGLIQGYVTQAEAYFGNSDYDNALLCYEKALELQKQTFGENHPDTATTYNSIGVVYIMKEDNDNALEYFGKALAIRKKVLGEKNEDTATSYYNIGSVYETKEDYDRALEYYGKALDIDRTELGEEHTDTATDYNNIGGVYYSKGDYDRALEYYGKALTIREDVLGENHQDTATSYNNIGCVYHRKGYYDKALEYHGKALAVRKEILGEKDLATAQSYNNIGTTYRYKGEYDKALEYCGKALAIREEIIDENPLDTARSYNSIGTVYVNKGDYDKALEYCSRALSIRKEVLGENHQDTAESYNNIGMIYDSKGDYDKALEYCSKAQAIQEELFGEIHPDTATCYDNIGGIYYEKKDYDRAFEYYGRALAIRKEALGENHPDTATSYNNIGMIYNSKGDYNKALEHHEKAMTIQKEVFVENHPDMATCYYNIGCVYNDKGEPELAVSYWKKAQKVFETSKAYKDTIYEQKAMLFSNPPDKAFLRDTLSLAMDTVERARLDMSSMRDELLKEALPVYYYGVDFAAKDKKPKKAFEYSEALRSRGFLDQMGTEAALRLDGVTDGDRQRVQELVSRISVARTELERQGSMTKQERDEARYKKAGDELVRAEKELARLDEEIGRRVPAYTQLRNPTPVSVRQAQDWCGKKRAVLEYVLWSPDIAGSSNTKNADIGSYCIILTQKGVSTVRLDGDFDYAAAVNKLRDKVSCRKQEYQFEQERNELYKHLVTPVLSKLSGIEELVIVPDGCLSFLPFDILRKKEGAKCLGDQYAITLSPSVSVSVIADTHKKRTESVLAFGGAWYDKTLSEAEHRQTLRGEGTRGASKGADRGSLVTDFALTADNEAQLASMRSHIREYGPGDYFAKLTWQDLPGTVMELDTLREYIFTSGCYDERMQKNASEAELKRLSSSGKLKDYAVLHFACHGYFDRNISDMSSVLFSEVSGKLGSDSRDDGYLTIPETAVLRLDADMVCLSACETGLGEVKRGDGMVGLSRAFMVAGADRVGVSLWCIDDEATAEFMTRMYRKVRQEGKSYSRAYREVKAEFRKSEDFDHPYYWAAFVLYE